MHNAPDDSAPWRRASRGSTAPGNRAGRSRLPWAERRDSKSPSRLRRSGRRFPPSPETHFAWRANRGRHAVAATAHYRSSAADQGNGSTGFQSWPGLPARSLPPSAPPDRAV